MSRGENPSGTALSCLPADTSVSVLEVTVGEALRRAVTAHGTRVALVEALPDGAGRRWSYQDLLDDAERTAGLLLTRFAPGERVAVWAANCPEWVLLEFGAALAGLTLVTVNPAYRQEELSYVLRQSRAAGLVVQERYRSRDLLATARDVAGDLPELREVTPLGELARAIGGSPGSPDLPVVEPRDPAQIQYTSGTTGRPKGALLSHRGLVNNGRFFAMAIGAGPSDIWVNPMPLFHTAGCGLATLGALCTGGAHVLPGGFDAPLMLDLLQAERGTLLLSVPTMLIRMLDEQAASPRDLSSWRLTALGGAPVPRELVRRAERELEVQVAIGYGQTESSPYITHTRPGDPDPRWAETVGRPLPHTEVKIADPETGATRPRGQPGEVCARGYSVMLGYFDEAEATRAAVDSGGWLHTGDLGSIDDAGYLRIQGRLRDTIIRGGENIYPREIEDVLFAHPDVADAAVVGLPDPEWGEIVGAFVRLRPGAQPSAEDLGRYCRERLASFKVPRIWRFVDSYPQTASGKIQKFALREQYVTGQAVTIDGGRPAR
jgi:acyl-CoA synthetase (AMP-forming)/AMP-acid ligase II